MKPRTRLEIFVNTLRVEAEFQRQGISCQPPESIASMMDRAANLIECQHENLVLPQLERGDQPGGKRRVEANTKTKAGVGRSGVARGVVTGGSR